MSLAANFPKNNWANYLSTNKPAFQFTTASKRRVAVKELVEEVQYLIDKMRFGGAIDRIVLAIYLDKSYAIAVLKREGILRHSSYLERRNPIAGFAEHILTNSAFLQLSETDITYFEAIRSMNFVHELLKGLKQRIQTELAKFKKAEIVKMKGKTYRKSRLKSLLSINERIFLYDLVGDGQRKDATSLEFYSKEEVSEAISYLLALYNKRFGAEVMDVYFIDEKYAMSHEAEKLILFACLIKNIQDIEILVESFGYAVIKEDAKFSFHSPDIAFAQSLDMSNIIQDLQTQSNNFWIFKANPEALSLFDLAKGYHQRFPDSFKLETDPFPRYVLKIPMPLFEFFLNKKDISFFKEELIVATGIQTELLLSLNELQEYEIAEGLTFYDFLKLLRLFIMKAYLLYEKMIDLKTEEERNVAHRSLPALYKEDDLKEVLKSVSSEKAIEQFLKILSWEVSNKEAFLDLQYQPLVKIGNYYLVQSIILGSSNIPRSIFLSENKRATILKPGNFLSTDHWLKL